MLVLSGALGAGLASSSAALCMLGDRVRCAEVRATEESQRLQEIHAKEHAEGAMGSIQGEVVSATLDFLSKELVRLNEHHKIASIVRSAEIARRER